MNSQKNKALTTPENWDAIIIGAGLAGMSAAVSLAQFGKRVLVLSKIPPLHTHSVSARGGMNAAIEETSVDEHIQDTLTSGQQLGDSEAVFKLCHDAPNAILWLESLGVKFSKSDEQKFLTKSFAGNSTPRACYSKGRTGFNCLKALVSQANKLNVEILSEQHVVQLVRQNERVCGLVSVNRKDLNIHFFSCEHVIIASGGGTNFYQHTSNAKTSTCDGLSLALNAGACLQDIEFIQFHPLGLAHNGIQFPEPVVAAGAQLKNDDNVRFMYELDPQLAERVSRDKLSLEIAKQYKNGSQVWLSLAQVDEQSKHLCKEAEQIAKTYLNQDVYDLPIAVSPSAHYLIGGIRVNLIGQAINHHGEIIEGLYAVGECASNGVHGANRLGGNSLVETVVFGRQVAQTIKDNPLTKIDMQPAEYITNWQQYLSTLLAAKGTFSHGDISNDLKAGMSANVGVIREEQGLLTQLSLIALLKQKYLDVNIKDKGSFINKELFDVIELSSLIEIAEAITLAALKRKESRGAHFRTDFPTTKAEQDAAHSLTYKNNKQLFTELSPSGCDCRSNHA